MPLDSGLYVPTSVLDLRQFSLYMEADTSYQDLVATIAPLLLQGELNPFSASRITENTFYFTPELQTLNDHCSLLSLYNGPTGTFKDFGLNFLAAVMEELLKHNGQATVVSAVRGRTGASVAYAFHQRHNIRSVLLYPDECIYGLDANMLNPNDGSLIPIQVQGNFNDCQRLVQELLMDRVFTERYSITTANSINVGRLLPQIFYYLYAFVLLKKTLHDALMFSVPSGNFGNLIAGLYAWKFGMPVHGFIAAMNRNNPFEHVRIDAAPPAPISTNSPALDITFASNGERLASFYEEFPAVMRNMVFPVAIEDKETTKALAELWDNYGIVADPQTAVAFAAAQNFKQMDVHVVILATGHPALEAEIVSQAINHTVEIPQRLSMLSSISSPIATIKPDVEALEGVLSRCF
jgi:threonine synthase